MSDINNPYLPLPVRIDDIITETEDASLKTFKLVFKNNDDGHRFQYQAGQFAELSIAGKGEIPIGIASSPVEKGFIMFTVNRAGKVTTHLHRMAIGDTMGVRGPLGNAFPFTALEGKDILIIGGGFAFTTLRSSIVYLLHPEVRKKFGRIDVFYGARSPGMLLYKNELIQWEKRDDINVHITVDNKGDQPWDYHEGLIPSIVEKYAPLGGENRYAIVCGPPVMIKFTQPVLDALGYHSGNIFLSLENRMKCGIGMCGRCGIGKELVCIDGPIFTLKELSRTPREY